MGIFGCENNISFRMELNDIRREVEEEYYYGALGKPPDNQIHRHAMDLLEEVFGYVVRFPKEEHTVPHMLKCLKFLREGEYLFLIDGDSVRSQYSPVFRNLKNDEKGIIELAANYLVYYAKYVEKKATDKYEVENLHKSLRRTDEGKVIKEGVFKLEDLGEKKQFPIYMKHYLDEYVVGQNELKENLSMLIYHYLAGFESRPVLMIGDTGSGKNYVISMIKQFFEEKAIKVPVIVIDTSKITMNGFSGDDLGDCFKIVRREMEKNGSDKAIVYMDEFDKIIISNTNSTGENVNGMLQKQLLSTLGGTTVTHGVDTSKILFILGGAFSELKALEKNKKSHEFGFCNVDKKEGFIVSSIRDDLVEIGMERELCGRISTVIEMKNLTREDMMKILLHEKIGTIGKKTKEYAYDDLQITMDEEIPELICDLVMEQNLGARGLTNVVEKVFGNYNFKMLEKGYTSMHIHSGVLLRGEEPVFDKGDDFSEKIKRCG